MQARHLFLPLLLGLHTSLEAQPGFGLLSGGAFAEDAVGVMAVGTGFQVAVRAYDPAQGHRLELRNFTGTGQPNGSIIVPLAGRVFAQHLEPMPAGGSVVCGARFATDSTALDPLLVRFDAAGNVLWTWSPALPGGQVLLGATPLTDGSLAVTGLTEVEGKHDVVVGRISANGQQLWYTVVPGPLDEEGNGLAADASGLTVTGRQMNYGGQADAWFARVDLSGNVVWTTSWGGARDDAGQAIARNGTACVMAGRTRSHGAYDHTSGRWNQGGYLLAIDDQGDTLWQRMVADTVYDREFRSITVAPNGDLFVAGSERDATTDVDVALLMRLTANGATVWERRHQLADEERPAQVRALPVGAVVCGSAFDAAGRQVMLLRTDANGN